MCAPPACHTLHVYIDTCGLVPRKVYFEGRAEAENVREWSHGLKRDESEEK